MRFALQPPKALSTDGTVVQLVCTSQLYRVSYDDSLKKGGLLPFRMTVALQSDQDFGRMVSEGAVLWATNATAGVVPNATGSCVENSASKDASGCLAHRSPRKARGVGGHPAAVALALLVLISLTMIGGVGAWRVEYGDAIRWSPAPGPPKRQG
ncbi:hypothetical protein T484DRAFT_1896335 [Baffinella frigidus]|nr:hypothetical protein T484DRAFT_1896335 [Cryptophyta sp. CCMP2293]